MFLSGIDSQLMKSGESFKTNKTKILINEKFVLKKIIDHGERYNLYEGVDLIQQKYVNIYIKPVSPQNFFSKQIKDQLKNKISPPTIWSGSHKIQKHSYIVQVQEKYGPTLKSMFMHINKQISQKDFIHLFYQLLKLVQKIGSGGFVHRQLSLSTIIFDSSPQKNQLFILNTFSLKKKNEECPKLSTKYCSKGSHLGLNANIKDDLESICYIMLDIYSSGKFLRNHDPAQYENAKSILQPKAICPQLPYIFIDFYYYVMGMNYTDEINYFHWKNLVLKTISNEWITQPYSWMLNDGLKKGPKGKQNKVQSDESQKRQVYQQQNVHQQKQNINQKINKFVLQINANSMKLKLKHSN